MFRAMLFTILFGLVTTAVSAQATYKFEVTPTNGPTTELLLAVTEGGTPVVLYDNVLHVGATWSADENGNLHVYEGTGHAILDGGAGSELNDTGVLRDGNVAPPNNVAGTWLRTG